MFGKPVDGIVESAHGVSPRISAAFAGVLVVVGVDVQTQRLGCGGVRRTDGGLLHLVCSDGRAREERCAHDVVVRLEGNSRRQLVSVQTAVAKVGTLDGRPEERLHLPLGLLACGGIDDTACGIEHIRLGSTVHFKVEVLVAGGIRCQRHRALLEDVVPNGEVGAGHGGVVEERLCL